MHNLKIRFLALTVPLIVLLMAGAFVGMDFIVKDVIDELGRNFTTKEVLYNRSRSLTPLIRLIALARVLANSPTVIEWAKDENDPSLKARGLAELEVYRKAFPDGSYFFVIDGTGNYYSNDDRQSFTGIELRYTISPDKAKDAWYYATKRKPKKCQLNVDNDIEIQVTKVWVNCLVHDGGTVVGVIGSGIDLTEFIQTAVKSKQAGVTNMFVDGDGSIQVHSNFKEIDFHSLTNAPDERKTIFRMADDENGRDKLRTMFKRLKADPKQVEIGFLDVQEKRTLVGISAMEEIGWFAVTFLDIEALKLSKQFVPIAILMAGAIALTLVVIAVLLDRTVLSRIAKLEKNVRKVRDGDYTIDAYDAGSDEIGRLNDSFMEMAGRIKEYTQELEKKVRDRTVDLLNAKEEAEKANQTKSEFLSSMSHELRTPLNAVLGFGQMLQMDTKNALSPKQREWVDAVLESGNHLLDLVNQILDLAKIEASEVTLTMEPLLVSEVLKDIEPTVIALVKTEKLELSFSSKANFSILADKVRLKQILLNLISNAVKYNTPNGTVEVTSETQNGIVRINVRDTGSGIPAELHNNIFEPFYRVEANRFLIEGTGIGLTITKSLTEMMNGEIGFESTVGQGSTFWVSFPEQS